MTNPQDVVQAYRNAGWNLPFPLPAGKKFPPPEGFTGVYGQYPDGHDVRIWIEQDRYHNYGIRAPEGVIGIDWDAYKGHPLYAWLTVYVDAAPRSTSKGGDQNAAIYWLRVDEDLVEQLRDRHFAEAGTEVIRKQHRYAVVWPSIHPDTGDRYEWYGPLAGADLDENYAEPLDYPPAIDDLPHIPRATVEAAIKQYGGGKRTSSGVSRRGAGELQRDVELSELGGIKALMKGYQPYAVEVDEEMLAARRVWEAERRESIIDELDELVGSADAWESSVGSIAFKLISLALAPWSETTLDDAVEIVAQYGPTCELAIERGVHGHGKGRCWTSADNRARAERSITQHDGGWTQLPPKLRSSSTLTTSGGRGGRQPTQEADQADEQREPSTANDHGEEDDFFDDDVPVRRDPSSLFLRLDRSLARQTRPKPIAGGMLYAGVFNIVSGRGGLGKSTAVQAICAEHGPTLWLSTEESWGAVHDRALVLDNEDFYAPAEPLTVMDCDVIFEWLAENEHARTVVIDNLQAFFKLGADSNNNTVVRDAFLLFWQRAEALGMTVVGVSHPPKSGATTVQGSAAWEEVSRHVLKMHEMEEDGYTGLALTVAKTNLHTRPYDTWPVTIETVEIPIPAADGTIETTSRAIFPAGETLRDMLRAAMGGAAADHKAQAAKRSASRHRNDLPDIDDIDTLITEGWVEPGTVAAQFDVLPGRLRALAEKHDLVMLTAADGRLVYIGEHVAVSDVTAIPVGTHLVADLMRQFEVGQVTHLTWLISAAGLHADYHDDQVTITNPERDEVADALRDAGLEEL
jgi:hypothetical protein